MGETKELLIQYAELTMICLIFHLPSHTLNKGIMNSIEKILHSRDEYIRILAKFRPN